ncbi:unnamed protein product [Protopolystoma xenopodis]|uniref:Uncharacterized protein n=1 Tax=Protopolystoma xenopodis TaxID=117903 RepID=A0A3S4ZRC9_9PLAT|nr:unnamed protein product [Protopolystoma xenopodis]
MLTIFHSLTLSSLDQLETNALSAFQLACLHGHLDSVRLLVEHRVLAKSTLDPADRPEVSCCATTTDGDNEYSDDEYEYSPSLESRFSRSSTDVLSDIGPSLVEYPGLRVSRSISRLRNQDRGVRSVSPQGFTELTEESSYEEVEIEELEKEGIDEERALSEDKGSEAECYRALISTKDDEAVGRPVGEASESPGDSRAALGLKSKSSEWIRIVKVKSGQQRDRGPDRVRRNYVARWIRRVFQSNRSARPACAIDTSRRLAARWVSRRNWIRVPVTSANLTEGSSGSEFVTNGTTPSTSLSFQSFDTISLASISTVASLESVCQAGSSLPSGSLEAPVFPLRCVNENFLIVHPGRHKPTSMSSICSTLCGQFTVLHLAIISGEVQLVSYLLKYLSADVNTPATPCAHGSHVSDVVQTADFWKPEDSEAATELNACLDNREVELALATPMGIALLLALQNELVNFLYF